MRPDGDYWVFLEVNEGAYGGRPRSDGPDCIDNLMANTRNNPIEDLAIHLPMICDRYELRDDVMPGAGRHRGGIGVVKAQRMLTDGFITHENERHHDVPWGIFGGHPGATGRVEIFNIESPNDRREMHAKYSGLRVNNGDVQVFYGPCGGGYGDPLERPAETVLEDVLDGFCTVEHARDVYGVILDLEAETVDEAGTAARRRDLRSALQPEAIRPPTVPTTQVAAASPAPRSAPDYASVAAPRAAKPAATKLVATTTLHTGGDGRDHDIPSIIRRPMATDRGSGITSAFDEMLAENRRQFEELYPESGDGRPPDRAPPREATSTPASAPAHRAGATRRQ